MSLTSQRNLSSMLLTSQRNRSTQVPPAPPFLPSLLPHLPMPLPLPHTCRHVEQQLRDMAAGVYDTRVLPQAEQLACTAPLEFLGCLLGCTNTSSNSGVVPGGTEGSGDGGGADAKWAGPEAQEAALRLQVGVEGMCDVRETGVCG
jgi:hypothetical protein